MAGSVYSPGILIRFLAGTNLFEKVLIMNMYRFFVLDAKILLALPYKVLYIL